MNERVLLHIGFLMEAFSAVLTGIRSGVRMDEEVRGQSGRSLKAFVADFTAEDPFLQKKKKNIMSKITQAYNSDLML